MSTQDIIEPTDTSNKHQLRDYVLYTKVRMRKDNVRKIKARATKYGQSFDDIIGEILAKLQEEERIENMKQIRQTRRVKRYERVEY
jgi:hypothetical protein